MSMHICEAFEELWLRELHRGGRKAAEVVGRVHDRYHEALERTERLSEERILDAGVNEDVILFTALKQIVGDLENATA